MFFSIIVLFPLWALVNAACPTGFTLDGTSGKCLQFFKTPASFQVAEQSCVSIGAHLVSIQNAFQNNAVLGSAQNSFGNSNYWIGASYNGSQWNWTDGSPFSFSQWASREPSAFYQCTMVLSSAGGTWKTSDCTGGLPYVCAFTTETDTTVKPILTTKRITKHSTTKSPKVTTTAPVLTTKSTVSLYCDPGWDLFQTTKYCYKRYHNATFDDAKAICQASGAHLASIHSDAENKFVFDMIKGSHSSFLGYHRTSYDSTWTWTDGSTDNYENWNPGAPDHKNKEANCVEIFGDNVEWYENPGLWQNIVCGSTTNDIVCKKHSTTKPPPPATPSTGPCESEWIYYPQTRYCYKAFALDGDFDDAEATCVVEGSHLVSIHSDAENSFVYNMTRNVEEMWIGLRRDSQKSDWAWTDGTTVNYNKWDDSAPNNKDMKANCVVMYSDLESWTSNIQEWNNIHCDATPVEFVCKKIGHL